MKIRNTQQSRSVYRNRTYSRKSSLGRTRAVNHHTQDPVKEYETRKRGKTLKGHMRELKIRIMADRHTYMKTY